MSWRGGGNRDILVALPSSTPANYDVSDFPALASIYSDGEAAAALDAAGEFAKPSNKGVER
jgi:hypothetical protein